jgi:hypothetical protein
VALGGGHRHSSHLRREAVDQRCAVGQGGYHIGGGRCRDPETSKEPVNEQTQVRRIVVRHKKDQTKTKLCNRGLSKDDASDFFSFFSVLHQNPQTAGTPGV